MGGIGSGRRWHCGAKHTTEDYWSIDVRWLKRRGMLEPGRSSNVTWSRHGVVTASIGISAESGRVVLDYRSRSAGEDWESLRYGVQLITTPCNMGGERHWFLCPAQGCGRRVAVLYGGRIFACRHCQGLAYPSQLEGPSDRAARKADRVRERLGWELGILNGRGWRKPRGMHWSTFQRLVHEHDSHVDRALQGFAEQLGLSP